MRSPIRLLTVAAALAVTTTGAAAQIRPPNIQGPINAAKKAAGTTSEQIKATDRVGSEPQTKQASQVPAAATQGGTKAATPQGKATARPSRAPGKQETSVSQEGAHRGATVTMMREAFSYNRGDRRDPFVSLMLSGELRPLVTDLVLTGVIYDESGGGRGSIAMLVDNSTGETYAVRIGQALGRMRVAKIGRENITFDIDEFGLSRSETLAIDKTSKAGAPAPRRP